MHILHDKFIRILYIAIGDVNIMNSCILSL